MITNIQASSLHKIFTDNTFKTFTPEAIAAGVNSDSIIYITCLGDTQFGEEFKDGETFIWAKGNFYGGPSITDAYIQSLFTEPSSVNNEVLSNEEITNIVNNKILLLLYINLTALCEKQKN